MSVPHRTEVGRKIDFRAAVPLDRHAAPPIVEQRREATRSLLLSLIHSLSLSLSLSLLRASASRSDRLPVTYEFELSARLARAFAHSRDGPAKSERVEKERSSRAQRECTTRR